MRYFATFAQPIITCAIAAESHAAYALAAYAHIRNCTWSVANISIAAASKCAKRFSCWAAAPGVAAQTARLRLRMTAGKNSRGQMTCNGSNSGCRHVVGTPRRAHRVDGFNPKRCRGGQPLGAHLLGEPGRTACAYSPFAVTTGTINHLESVAHARRGGRMYCGGATHNLTRARACVAPDINVPARCPARRSRFLTGPR